MTTLHAYAHREPNNCFLPRDVLDALSARAHVRQGRLYIFAPTAEAAWRRLSTLDLEPRSVRDLCRVNARPVVKALVDAKLDQLGAVYATGLVGRKVVSIRQDLSDRLIDYIGEIQQGRFVPAKEPTS